MIIRVLFSSSWFIVCAVTGYISLFTFAPKFRMIFVVSVNLAKGI
jgi:hypothetical protein